MASTSTDRIDGLVTSQAIKAPVRVATTANITLSGTQTIDVIAVVAEDRVLVKDQTTGTEDGIWVVKSGAWARAKDWDGARDATQGTLVSVKVGTTNANSIWRSTASDDPYVIGTVSPAFALAEFFVNVTGNIKYNFDSSTTTTEDPGDGDFRLNNATIASATVITFSNNSADVGSPDVSDIIATWDDSTSLTLRGTITISELGAPEVFATFSVNAAITDGTTYLDVPVVYVAGSGSFTAASGYAINFARTGDVGGGMENVVEDITPQLGGFLDTNSKFISVSQGTAVASVAGDTDIWANFDGNTIHITGTNAITDFGTPKQAGDHMWVIFDGAASVVDSATITVDGNANFQAAANDLALVYALTTSTFLFKPFPNSGALFTDVDRTLTAGFGGTDAADGTKSSGTYTPTYVGGNFKTATNGGAHTLAPQSGTGTIIIQYTNDGSAGAITTSGWTFLTGDAFTTTNGDDFMAYLSVVSTFKHLHVVAMQ